MKHLFKALIISLVVLPLLAACGNKNETKYLAVKLAGSSKWSIIDIKDGSLVVEDEFENAPTPIVNDRFFVKNKKDEMELYDITDINDPIETYKSATAFCDDRAIVSPDGKKMEVIDTKGEVVKKLPGSYRTASGFMNGCAIVINDNEKTGYINTDGEVVVKIEYDQALPFSDDHYAVVAKSIDDDDDDDEYPSYKRSYNVSIINMDNEKQFGFTVGDEAKYNDIITRFFQNGSIAVRKDDEIVYLDGDGKEFLKAGDLNGNNDLYGIYKGLTVYADDEDYGIKDDNGETVLKAKYKILAPIKNGNFLAQKDDDWSIINQDGEKISNDEYAAIVMITEKRFLVKDKPHGKWYLIDEEGNQIGEEEFSDYVLNEPSSVVFSFLCSVEGSDGDDDDDEELETSAIDSASVVSAEAAYDYAPSYDAAEPYQDYEYAVSASAPVEEYNNYYDDAKDAAQDAAKDAAYK